MTCEAHEVRLQHPVPSAIRRVRVALALLVAIPLVAIALSVGVADASSTASLSPLRSPDVGDHCATGLGAGDLSEFFARPIGSIQGGDYQRAIRLPDDRVLWTLQDAFVDGHLVHNVAMVQSGRCFSMLGRDHESWLFDGDTVPERRWHWILGGDVGRDESEVHLFVVEMGEPGPHYLSNATPVALRRVVVDAATLEPERIVDVAATGHDLYGWTVTSTDRHTYLYSHCYQQFGHDTLLGFGSCVAEVRLARVPRGEFDAAPEYWTGTGWDTDHRDAAPVIDATFVGSGNNPAQVRFDGSRFVAVEKRDDWWGSTIEFGVSVHAEGPFTPIASITEPVACRREVCNTYFASWVPWLDRDGSAIWSISHNRWDGSETSTNLGHYRPTFHTMTAESVLTARRSGHRIGTACAAARWPGSCRTLTTGSAMRAM